MNIYQKLLEVRKAVPYLRKESQGHQYQYTGSSQVLGAVRQKLDELGLVLVTKVVGHTLHDGKTEKGKREVTTELDMEFIWVNAEKPEEQIVIPWYGQGVDNAEKGVGKALTYAEKYFMLKEFNIPTDKDDPDAFQQKTTKPDPISAEQVGILKKLALEYANMRGGTDAKVFQALKISDVTKLTSQQAQGHIDQVMGWIEKAKETTGA